MGWQLSPTFRWEIPPCERQKASFWQFSAIGTLLDYQCSSARNQQAGLKEEIKMSSHSQFTRTLVALAAALVMSTVAVGAAVGPAQASAAPAKVSLNA
jgi:hypothetical protein